MAMHWQSAPDEMFSPENIAWRTIVEQEIGPDFSQDLASAPQRPRLLWIGCADSRVPETIVMAARPGDIFVHRNIANQFHLSDDSAQSVLEFGVRSLEIRTIAVVGHTSCGGAEACLAAARRPADENARETALGRWLGPMTELARDRVLGSVPEDQALNRLIEQNVRAQVINVARTDTIQNAWRENQDVVIQGWVFEIESGKLRDLGFSATKTTPLPELRA